MNEELNKVIVIRSKLRNKFLKDKREQSANDRKQRNLCVIFLELSNNTLPI